MERKIFDLEELSWSDVAPKIKQYNKALFKAIEASSPSKKHTFIKATYPYGASIVQDGVVHLPHKSGMLVPLFSSEVDPKIQSKLAYSKIPLAFLSNKASEVFVKRGDRTIPLKLLWPGDLFGLFEVVDFLSGVESNPTWCVSSGANSIFMLPKITDKVGYQRIKKELNLEVYPPRSLAEHGQIFTTLCTHEAYIHNWYSEVYFFTNQWFDGLENNLELLRFYNYIFKECVVQKHFTDANIEFDSRWQNFTMAIGARNLRPRPYILETAKYLFAISNGMLPGFKTADRNDVVAPIQLLQNIYAEIYSLRSYLPTLMYPCNLKDKQQSLYYSLSLPSVIEGLPPHKKNSNADIISDMRLMKRLLTTPHEMGEKNIHPKELKEMNFEYFHSEPDIYNEIHLANKIPINDTAFLQDKEQFPNREFCATAPFFSGCIRVSS